MKFLKVIALAFLMLPPWAVGQVAADSTPDSTTAVSSSQSSPPQDQSTAVGVPLGQPTAGHDMTAFWCLTGGVVTVSLLLALLSIRAIKRRRILTDNPTSKIKGVFIGFVEVKGRAVCDHPLRSYLAGIECVQYGWTVEEHWEKTIVEEYQENGKTKYRTRKESGWKTVDSGSRMVDFLVQDDTGFILVRPTGAELKTDVVFSRSCGKSDPLYYGKGPSRTIENSTGRRRFSESAIPLHAELYVAGQAREREDMVAPVLAKDPDALIFLISTKSKESVQVSFALQGWLFALAGCGCLCLYWHLILGKTAMDQWPYYSIPSGAFLGVWCIGWLWMAFNNLNSLRQRVRQSASNLDVQLKRRADLIPNLARVVRESRGHESGVLEALTRLRDLPVTDTLSDRVLSIVERYPALRANSNFLSLQKELSSTESRIALARAHYAEIATFFNVRIQTVPDTLVASLFRMEPFLLSVA